MKLTCIIIDDEPIARKILREYIEDVKYLTLFGEAENPLSASSLLENRSIDIIFLDINMPKLNGLDFLKNSPLKSSVILTTAYAEHAVEAFALNVVDYLVKPIAFERFLKACNKVRELTLKGTVAPAVGDDGHFFVKSDDQIEKIAFGNLWYVEAMLNYVMFVTTEKKIIVYMTMKSLEAQLPAAIFIRVHKSFIANVTKIKKIDGNDLDLGIRKIPLSQSLREKVLKEIVKDKMINR